MKMPARRCRCHSIGCINDKSPTVNVRLLRALTPGRARQNEQVWCSNESYLTRP